MKKIAIIGIVVILAGAAVWFYKKGPVGQQVSKVDVVDTVNGFYDQWLKATLYPSTAQPSRAELAKSPILSKELKERLTDAVKNAATPDPVLCQKVAPAAISTRKIYENEKKAQAVVTSRDKKVTDQAIVTLNRLNDGWYIDSIECSAGEFEAPREFTFEKEGYLIKASVPKPYDAKNWHLVFEENGEQGHIVPLFFDASSECTSLSGTKSVCKPDQFTEATKVSVKGQMSERGASVKHLEFVK